MWKISVRAIRTGALACACALISLSLGCEEDAGGLARIEVSRFSIDVTELQIENNCDPADNPDGGDFSVGVEIYDTTDGGRRRVAELDPTIVLRTKTPGAFPVSIGLDGETPQEPGRRLRLVIDFAEVEGPQVYDARAIEEYDFTWSEEDGCWSYDRDPERCMRPGDEMSFGFGLNDDTAPYCSAGLLWTAVFDTVRRTPTQAHAGRWYADELSVDITPVSGGDRYFCVFAQMGLALDPEEAGAVGVMEGEGECLRFYLPSGVDYRFRSEAWFESDTEMAGRLIFEAGETDFEIPFEGTRSLDEVEITFSATTSDVRPGGSLGDLHWTGGGVLER